MLTHHTMTDGPRTALTQGPITPRRGYRRWHYAPSGSWDAELIAAAMHSWARETRTPPRSWEWCPSAARSAGLMSETESKWEREHPRWPGNTTVYRHFDSWASALEAAGLPPSFTRHECKLPLAERVVITERMAAAGVAVREIAGELCVGIATAYRYLKAHPCSDCAGPVVGEGERCLRCATRRSNPKRWSARELLDAIIAWEQLEGRPPANMDWRPSTERLCRHLLVCGATGSGKTETVLRLAWTIAKSFDAPVFYLDGKGDRETAEPLLRADG